MQVFLNLADLQESFAAKAREARLQGLSGAASRRARHEERAAAYEAVVFSLNELQKDSPDLFTIPTEWAKARVADKTGVYTAADLLKGFVPGVLEASKPWIACVMSGGERRVTIDYYDSASEAAEAAAEYCRNMGYTEFGIFPNGPVLSDDVDPLDVRIDDDVAEPEPEVDEDVEQARIDRRDYA